MNVYKDAYLAAVEIEMARLEDAGIPAQYAYELASKRAYDRMLDHLRDQSDDLRLRWKSGE